MALGLRGIVALMLAADAGLAQSDPAEGERLYTHHCAHCHGLRGDGGRGASLARPRLRHAPYEPALIGVITRGIPGTEMPRTALSPRQVRLVAAYVRTLGRAALDTPPPGDPVRGQRLYETKGNCGPCHGAAGPDLTAIGARSSPAYLRASLVDPEAEVPPGFLQVRIAARDGRRITGVRVNEDTFSIQVRDLAGGVQSFWKSELAELHKDWGRSPMPSYRAVFTSAEIDDLVAYLVSLQ